MLFRHNSHWFRLEFKTHWAVYFKEEIYVMDIILETIKRKEIPPFKVGSRNLVGSKIVLQHVDINDLSSFGASEIRVDL